MDKMEMSKELFEYLHDNRLLSAKRVPGSKPKPHVRALFEMNSIIEELRFRLSNARRDREEFAGAYEREKMESRRMIDQLTECHGRLKMQEVEIAELKARLAEASESHGKLQADAQRLALGEIKHRNALTTSLHLLERLAKIGGVLPLLLIGFMGCAKPADKYPGDVSIETPRFEIVLDTVPAGSAHLPECLRDENGYYVAKPIPCQMSDMKDSLNWRP